MQISTSGQWGSGMKWSTLGGQEVKDQGHTRMKIDLEAWQRHRSRPLGVK